jgi:penicillin-binding protein 2
METMEQEIEPTVAETIPGAEDGVYSFIEQGMIAASVTNMPIEYSLGNLGYSVAIKTGTPEQGSRVQDSFFIGYAPADDPEIAFAGVIEGGEYSKYMIRSILEAYEAYKTRTAQAQ